MTKRRSIPTAPEPLEAYARHFDDLFGKSNQRDKFRRYLEGLLLPTERNKTLTGLANTEPSVGAQHSRAQGMQWFLSEACWQEKQIQQRRLQVLFEEPSTAPNGQGVLVIDEHGDRKKGPKTAHIGRQYLANLGKIDNGIVSVTSLWADEEVYYPLDFEPYTPADYFAEGKQDPAFRTKLKIALQLVQRSIEAHIAFRAVVADNFYGEDCGFRQGLRDLHVGYVLALKPSHTWWHPQAEIGSFQAAAKAAGWECAEHPGCWINVRRMFRDGSSQDWWALELDIRPYGPDKPERVIVATTDPATLPELTTFYLITNLSAPGSQRAQTSECAAASVEEVVRLYGLRMWVEQSYKQVKYALGWSEYQVRSDRAMRRHWQLVCCAFSFCWYHQAHAASEALQVFPAQFVATEGSQENKTEGKKSGRDSHPPSGFLAQSPACGEGVAGTLGLAPAILASLVDTSPSTSTPIPG